MVSDPIKNIMIQLPVVFFFVFEIFFCHKLKKKKIFLVTRGFHKEYFWLKNKKSYLRNKKISGQSTTLEINHVFNMVALLKREEKVEMKMKVLHPETKVRIHS